MIKKILRTSLFAFWVLILVFLYTNLVFAGYHPRAGRSDSQLDIWFEDKNISGDTTISISESGTFLGNFSAIDFDTNFNVKTDVDTAIVESEGGGSFDSYDTDVSIDTDSADTITHNLGTITPTVVVYSDTEVPYDIVDLPVAVTDDNRIVLETNDQFVGKVRVSK